MTLRFASPLRPTVGTRPVAEPDWLITDAAREQQLTEKRRLLAERPAEVRAGLSGAEQACAEAGRLVLDWYRRFRPDVAIAAADREWDAAALTAAEDLCVMQRRDGEWRLTAAQLCFPSRWRLSEKLGEGLAGIHAPVPGYAGPVAVAAERVFDRMEPGRILLRFNWSMLDDATLYQPEGPAPGAEPVINDPGAELFLRTERQTLRLLPASRAVLFTIHTHVTDLASVAADPGAAAELAASLRSAAPDTVAYKGWRHSADIAARWLIDRAGPVLDPPPPTTA